MTHPINEGELQEVSSLATESPVVEHKTEEHLDEGTENQYKLETGQDAETQFENLSIDGLIESAQKLAESDDFFEGAKVFKEIKTLFDEQVAQIVVEQGAEGEEPIVEVSLKKQEYKLKFEEAYAKFNDRKADFRRKTERERIDNLEAKRVIINRLKEINQGEESEEHVNEVRELQSKWKQVRWVPQEYQHEINESYRFQLDYFYDKVSIFYDLKQKDRDKNLELKIELCKKVDDLKNEPSIKRSLILLNKFWEEWKNTGPVPKESAEELYNIFKRTSDEVYELKKAELTRRDEEKQKNLQIKIAICEKLELLNSTWPDKPREWITRANIVNEIFEDWKKVGLAPGAENENIWKRFKNGRNAFYQAKNEFFKGLNKEKDANMALKEALCEQAEAVQSSSDWNSASVELKRLQLEWKKIGPVSDKQADTVWKRFRDACNKFFDSKSEHFKDQREEQKQNLDKKRDLLEKFELLGQTEDMASVFEQVKTLQQEWTGIGYVPYDKKESVSKRYDTVMDKIYGSMRKHKSEMSEVRLKEHYTSLAGAEGSGDRLNQEARRIRERIKGLEAEVQTWENNLGFFSKSSKGNPMIQQMEEKVSKGNAQIERLKAELKVIQKTASASAAK